MGNSKAVPGGDALAARSPQSNAIRRLAVSTCVLAVAAVVTLFVLEERRMNEDRRLVLASQLAEETLDEVLRSGSPGEAFFPGPHEESVVSEESGERYTRRVEISPRERDGSRRVTVTIGWQTISGVSSVSVRGRLNGREIDSAASRAEAPRLEIRGALSP